MWIVNEYILLIKKVTTTFCTPQINIRKLKVNKVEKYSLHNKTENQSAYIIMEKANILMEAFGTWEYNSQ